MKKYISIVGAAAVCFVILAFFYQTILFGKLPVPTDSLVGLYHPWRDFYALKYPRGMPFKNFLITDSVRQQIPWRKLVIDEWKNGRIPSWNPTSFSGTPLAANVQSGAFSPFNILFLLMPFAAAWSILIILQPVIGGVGMFLYLQTLGLMAPAAIVGAILFALSGASVAWMTWGTIGHVIMWTPCVLTSIEVSLASTTSKVRRLFSFAFVTCLFVFQITAGHVQIAFYAIVLSVVYAIWRCRAATKRSINAYIGLAVASVSAVIITLPFLTAVMRFLAKTNRFTSGAFWMNEGFFFPPAHLVQLIAPDFFGNPATMNYWGTWNYGEMVSYVGILGIMLALLAVLSWKTRPHVRFWALVAGLCFMFAMKHPITLAIYTSKIPFLSSMQPTRLLVIADMALAVLAAYGMDSFLREKNRAIFRYVFLSIGGAIFIAWIIALYLYGTTSDATWQTNLAVAKRNLIFPAIIYAISVTFLEAYQRLQNKKFRVLQTVVTIGVVGLVIVDLFRFGWKFLPFTDHKLFFPETPTITFLKRQKQPFRIMSLDDRVLPPDTYAYFGLSSVAGYDPLKSSRYERLMAAIEQNRSGVRPPFGFDRIMNPKNYHSRLFPLLHVRYILALEDIADAEFIPVFREGETRVYEYTHFLPYGYFPETVTSVQDGKTALTMMFSENFDSVKHAIVEAPAAIVLQPLSAGETVETQQKNPSIVQFTVHAASDRFFATGLMYDRGWQATVDGTIMPIYQTNYVYSGIIVPKGDHTVVFAYSMID